MDERPKNGRKEANILTPLLNNMRDNNYLTPEFVLALRKWREGLNEGRLEANATTKEKKIEYVSSVLEGLENARELAADWIESYGQGRVSPESEAGLRIRVADEIMECKRKGGVINNKGELLEDVDNAVERAMFHRVPGLEESVRVFQEGRKKGAEGGIIDVEFTAIS